MSSLQPKPNKVRQLLGSAAVAGALLCGLGASGMPAASSGPASVGRSAAFGFARTAGVAGLPGAQSWGITFASLENAMQRGSYKMDLVRRVREVVLTSQGAQSQWRGTKQHLEMRWQGGRQDFRMVLTGIEGKRLTATELAKEQAEFETQHRTQFRYHGFQVEDAIKAEQNYALFYIGAGRRLGRPTFKVLVLPRFWDRSAWLLVIDQRTGYPLYQGQYSLSAQLLSEVEVTAFDDQPMFGPGRWSTPSTLHKTFGDAKGALLQAFPGRPPVVPGSKELPTGYSLSSSRLRLAPFSGRKSVVLIYSDGVGFLFVQVKAGAIMTKAQEDALGHRLVHHDGDSLAQCQFEHRGLKFVLHGVDSRTVKASGKALYRRAIGLLK